MLDDLLKFSFPEKEEAEALVYSGQPHEGHPVLTPPGTHMPAGLSAVTPSEVGHQLATWIKVLNKHKKGIGSREISASVQLWGKHLKAAPESSNQLLGAAETTDT